MSKRILTMQDVSCVGQCSTTVALPICSACGLETAILPTALLSTHTAPCFTGFTVLNLTDEDKKILSHWQKIGLTFDALYTGYLGNASHVQMVKEVKNTLLNSGAPYLYDPAFADNGKLYYGFDGAYVNALKELIPYADVILPNFSEACFLTDTPYAQPTEDGIRTVLEKLEKAGAKSVVLTGIGDGDKQTGVLVYGNGKTSHYLHEKVDRSYHGTGDVYAAAFTGAYLQGKTVEESAAVAADFTLSAIKNTLSDDAHGYGVKFEPMLPVLQKRLGL